MNTKLISHSVAIGSLGQGFALALLLAVLVSTQPAIGQPRYSSTDFAAASGWSVPHKLPVALENNLPNLNAVISIDRGKVPLRSALEQIAEEADLKLSYGEELVLGAEEVNLSFENVTVLEALYTILRDTRLRLNISPTGYLILVPKPESRRKLKFTSTIGSAPGGKLTGRITDAETGQPLPGVNIIIRGTSIGSAADADGFYTILNAPTGVHDVTASMVGYQRLTKTGVQIKLDQTTELDFVLSPEVIGEDEVVVVAERPIVERDLTASKESITAQELMSGPVRSIAEAIEHQSGVNIHGGVRGGMGNDVVYYVDGMEMLESGGNVNYTGINTTSVEQVEVLTGGWNAEYGRARSAVVSLQTKTATDRIHGIIRGQLRPAGRYHWGRNIYSRENYEWREMATLAYWTEHDGGGFWKEKTPEERLEAFKNYISFETFGGEDLLENYAERVQWETEATLYGPITNRLNFMVSGRYLRGVNPFPSSLAYNPEWHYQGKLNYDLGSRTRLTLDLLYGGYDTSEKPQGAYYSSDAEHTGGGGSDQATSVTSAYYVHKHWPWGTAFKGGLLRQPPEYFRMTSGQIQLQQTLGAASFVEVALSWKRSSTERHWRETFDPWMDDDGIANQYPQNPLFLIPRDGIKKPARFRVDGWFDETRLEATYMQQLGRHNLVKTGGFFSYGFFKKVLHEGGAPHVRLTDYTPFAPDHTRPYEGAFYLQDKLEYEGIVVNAGVRLDFFNGNKAVSNTIWDPLWIDENTPGNLAMNRISFDPDGENAVHTPTQFAVSPRLGISHPITETSVLHFTYGHFNMRPSWQKIIGPVAVNVPGPWTLDPPMDPIEMSPHPTGHEYWEVLYNPWYLIGNPELDFEKMIQYEVGWDQSVADLARLKISLYYKDGKGLTSFGNRNGPLTDFGQGGGVDVQLFPDDRNPNQWRNPGFMGTFWVPVNAGYMDARGVETVLSSAFSPNVNLRLAYNLSYVLTGTYGLSQIYREFDEGRKLGRDSFHGVSNGDGGTSGDRNERWNPHNTLKVSGTFRSPEHFGPELLGAHPLAKWNLSIYSVYSSGRRFTYHGPDDFSTEPLNERWKPRYRTDLKLTKGFGTPFGVEAEFSVDVRNLFNQRRLRLFSGDDLMRYMEEGLLPRHQDTGEKLTWEIYQYDLMPREIFFGLTMRW